MTLNQGAPHQLNLAMKYVYTWPKYGTYHKLIIFQSFTASECIIKH